MWKSTGLQEQMNALGSDGHDKKAQQQTLNQLIHDQSAGIERHDEKGSIAHWAGQ
jgi:hypothetical protein